MIADLGTKMEPSIIDCYGGKAGQGGLFAALPAQRPKTATQRRVSAKKIYRDPVRSSHGHFVKASGLRWLSLMPSAPVPWAGRIWALPLLTALAPPGRYCRQRGRRHKTLTHWARHLVLQAPRGCPDARWCWWATAALRPGNGWPH